MEKSTQTMFETTIQISCDLRLRVVFILEVPGIGLRRLTQETTHTIACSLLPLPVTEIVTSWSFWPSKM